MSPYPRVLRLAWAVNAVMFGCALVAAILVDGNGRVMGMSELPSLILAVALFTIGVVSSAVVLFLDKRVAGKVAAVLLLAVYLALVVPAIGM